MAVVRIHRGLCSLLQNIILFISKSGGSEENWVMYKSILLYQ